MIIESLISMKGIGKYNNDVIGVIENLYYVLDGASALFDDNKFSDVSDLFSYMKKLNNNISNCGDLTSILSNAIARTTESFNLNNIEEYEGPTFTAAMIKDSGQSIDYYIIGDASVIIRKKDGNIITMTDNRIDPFKKYNRDKINQLPESPNKNQEIKKIYQETRKKLNQENGYPIASIKKESAYNGIIGTLNKGDITDIILCSDGFTTYPFNEENCFNSADIEKHIRIIFDTTIKRDDISLIHIKI